MFEIHNKTIKQIYNNLETLEAHTYGAYLITLSVRVGGYLANRNVMFA